MIINMGNLNDLNPQNNDTDIDFSYLKRIKPQSSDMRMPASSLNIDEEIKRLQKEMSELDLRSIPFDKYDFVLIFTAGLVGAACDILLGKPAGGYNDLLNRAVEPKINNDFAFGLGNFLKDYDLPNNPIDKNIPGIPVGDHRLYSYGHDLLRVFRTVKLMITGTGPVGISGLGGEVILEQAPEKWIESLARLGIATNDLQAFDTLPLDERSKIIVKILIILFLHLYKDYCSARSLPIPGSTFLANLNNNEMPEFLNELTNSKELNLRTLSGQALSIASIELILSVYALIRKKSDKEIYTDEQYKNKSGKTKLIAHSVALAFNTGKVILTGNPAFINLPQIIRVVNLSWHAIKAEIKINHNSIEKIDLGVIKNKYETAQTLILLDDAIYCTKELDRLIADMKDEFDRRNNARNENLSKDFGQIDDLLRQLKSQHR